MHILLYYVQIILIIYICKMIPFFHRYFYFMKEGFFMRKNYFLISGICMLFAVGMIVGCGGEKFDVTENQPVSSVEDVKEPVLPEEISEADIKKLLATDVITDYEIITHEVSVADDTNSEDGKYDLIDKVNVSITLSDKFDVIPQTINEDVYFMRDAESGQWEIVKETCRKWDAKGKQLGSTSWKMTTEEGDVYIRLRDTIEFFATQPDRQATQVDETQFSTTILGAIYSNEGGEPVLKRMHVTGGYLSVDGGIKLNITFPHTEEEGIQIDLNDFEKIDREELPFSEEEFREVSDQLG